MTYFNRLALFSLSIAVLSNCSLPKPQGEMPSNLSGQGSFFMDQASGKFVATETFDKIDLAKSRNISFRICLKDRRSRGPIMNQVFEIAEGTKAIAQSITDNAGCLTWSEELQFSIFKRSHNILLKREIRNRSRFNGHTFVHFAVNPWNNQIMSEIETDFKAEGLNPISPDNLMALPDTAELRVLPLRSLFTIQEVTQDQAVFKLDFLGQLLLENSDHLNQVFQVQINRAKLRSRVTILNRRKDGNYYLIHRTEWSKPEELKDALINIETIYDSNTSSCRNGRLDVALELDTSDSVEGLRPFEMIFQGPNCQATGFVLMVPHPGYQEAIRKGKALSLNHYLESEVKGVATMSLDGSGNVSYLRPLEFQASQVSGSVFDRTKVVRVQSCLTSVVDFDHFRREPMTITTMAGEKIPVVTDDEGCFAWNETIEIDYFAGQCWKQGFTKVEFESGRVKFQLAIGYIADGHANIFRDLRYFTIPESQLCNINHDLKSELYFSRVTFEKLDYTYDVDEFLNIILVKRGLLQITPFLRRESLVNPTGIDNDELPPGKYKLTLAMVDIAETNFDNFNGSKVNTITEKIVTVRAGSIISEPFEIRKRDIRSMGNTNRMYITIEPAEGSDLSKRNLRTRVFSGPIIPQNHHEVASVEVLDDDQVMTKIKTAAKIYEQRWKSHLKSQLSKKTFSEANRLKILNLDENNEQLNFRTNLNYPFIYRKYLDPNSNQRAVPLKDFKDFLDNPTNVTKIGQELCGFWFGDYGFRTLPKMQHPMLDPRYEEHAQRLVMRCYSMIKKNFSSVFDVQLQSFVQHPKMVVIDSAQFRDLGVGQNFSQNRSVSDTVSSTISWDVGGGLRLPDIPGLKLLTGNTGVRFAVSRAWSNAESQNMFEAISSGITINSETVRLKVESPKIERCLAIRLNMGLFAPVKNPIFGERPSIWFKSLNPNLTIEEKEHYALSGFLICEGQAQAKAGQFVETYAIFNQRMPLGASLLDPFSNNSRPFFSSVRGQSDYLKFVSFVAGALKIPDGFEGDYSRSGFREDNLKDLFKLGIPSHPGVTEAVPQLTTK